MPVCISKIYELYDKVIEAYKSMDEEIEYLHIRRCLILLNHAKKFKEFKNLPRNKVNTVHKYESLLRPRLEELKTSLEQRYTILESEKSTENLVVDKSLSSLMNVRAIRHYDPELGAFVKEAEKKEEDTSQHLTNIAARNTPYGDSLFSGVPKSHLDMHKPLYIAKSIGNLEYLSRAIRVPDLTFDEYIKRMFNILKLRKSVKDNDLEMDFILLSRYLTFNEKIRKLPEYHEKYFEQRHLLTKVVTIKNEYCQIKKLLTSKYRTFAHAMKIIQHLTVKEKMIEASVQGIKNRKAAWQIFIKDGIRHKPIKN
nr:uncharacterized protein LOC106685809 isoform X2 [Halyomorpha halys]